MILTLLEQEVDLDMADNEVNEINGIPDDVDNDSPSSGAAIEEAVNAALPFSKPPSRESSRASSKTRSGKFAKGCSNYISECCCFT